MGTKNGTFSTHSILPFKNAIITIVGSHSRVLYRMGISASPFQQPPVHFLPPSTQILETVT